MANILKVHEQNTIEQLAAQGWSRRRIARHLGIDRKTVRRYLREAAKSPTISTPGSEEPESSKSPISTPGEATGTDLITEALKAEVGRPSLCDPHRRGSSAKLDLGLSAQRIYQDLVAEVSIHRFLSVGQTVCPPTPPGRSASESGASKLSRGRRLQVDFGTGAPVIEADGRRRRPWVLRVVLSYSRKAYSEAVFHQTTENFIRCLENAFRSFRRQSPRSLTSTTFEPRCRRPIGVIRNSIPSC